MNKVAVVTDSVCGLPEQLMQEYDIRFVPMYINADGKSYRDQVDITANEYLEMSRTFTQPSTNSAPNASYFIDIFEGLASSASAIVCILVSSKLSITFEMALQAKEQMKEKYPNLEIEVIDSTNGAGALGLIALEAARAAQKGKSLAEIAELARSMTPKVKYIATYESGEYLKRIGRGPENVPGDEGIKLRPVMGMTDHSGVVKMLGRVHSKRAGLKKIVDIMREHTDGQAPLHVIFHYTIDKSECEQVKEMVTEAFNCAEVHTSQYTAASISAGGPMIGLSFYS